MRWGWEEDRIKTFWKTFLGITARRLGITYGVNKINYYFKGSTLHSVRLA